MKTGSCMEQDISVLEFMMTLEHIAVKMELSQITMW